MPESELKNLSELLADLIAIQERPWARCFSSGASRQGHRAQGRSYKGAGGPTHANLPSSWFAYWPLSDGSAGTYSGDQGALLLEQTGGTLSDYHQLIRQRAKAIPTLGNLTLLNLSVNRAAQNKDFAFKKAEFMPHTVLSLNADLMARDSWGEEAITVRTR